MAPTPKPSKRDATLNAMLALLVERGFYDSPMSLLAERSASTGVIYHYFASKEEIIQAPLQAHTRTSMASSTKCLTGIALGSES